MNFLYPVFLAGALAIAIPIVLHFLRRDIAPEVPFSAVRLLRRSPVARARRRRLKDLLLLAARVAALILLAAAFARPYFAGAAASSSLRIIALDRSLSMGGPGRFARAVALATQAVDEAAAGERVALIAFDDRAEVLSEPGPASTARAALATAKAGEGGTQYPAVLAKASELAGFDAARLVIVTDLQRSGWNGDVHAVVPANLTVEVRDGGAPAANAAITAVRVTRDRIFATVRAEGGAAWAGSVRVERDGRTVATAPATVGAGMTVDVAIPYRSTGAGALEIAIDDAAGIPGDDRRYVVIDAVARGSALVVTGGAATSGFYLARALDAADGEIESRVVAASTLAPGDVKTQSAVLLLATRGIDRRAREAIAELVRGGGGVLVAASSEVEPDVLSTTFAWKPILTASEKAGPGLVLSATDVRHPILRPFGALAANLGQVRFDRTWRVGEDGWDVAARFSDGTAALLERREGRGRVMLFASDLDRRWNDFPLNAAYVPFVVEAVRYVAAARDAARDYVVAAAPAGAEPRAGVYRAAADNRLIAVNVDPRESTIAAQTPAQFLAMLDAVAPAQDGVRDARARQIEARQSYWQYGLLLMLAALVAESFVGRA